MGVGVLVRDCEEKVMATMCSPHAYIIDLTMEEAFEAWKAVLFGIDLGLGNVILESDALEIVNSLMKDGQSWSRNGNLTDDSKIILHSFQS